MVEKIKMSGLAIKNISPISLDHIFWSARYFQENILEPLEISIDSVSFIGSTGKKDVSGDMDIAIEYPYATSFTKDKYILADMITKKAEELGLQTNNRIKTGFQMVHIGLPICDEFGPIEDKICQLDLMFVSDLSYAQFKYDAPDKNESKYNGAVRSMLVNAFIKEASITCPDKFKDTDAIPYVVDGKEISPYITYGFYALGPDSIQYNVKTYRGKKGNFLTNPRKITEESKDCGCLVNLLVSKLFNDAVKNEITLSQLMVEHVCHTFENLWNSIISANFKDLTLKDRIVKTFVRLFNAANSWQYAENKKLSIPKEIEKYAKEHDIDISDSSNCN